MPERLVAEARRLTRPGGFVAAQEADFSTLRCFPPDPAWTTLAAAYRACFPFTDDDPEAHRVFRLMRAGGARRCRLPPGAGGRAVRRRLAGLSAGDGRVAAAEHPRARAAVARGARRGAGGVPGAPGRARHGLHLLYGAADRGRVPTSVSETTRGKRRVLALVLLKLGHGVKDAYLMPRKSRAEQERMLDAIAEETGAEDVPPTIFRRARRGDRRGAGGGAAAGAGADRRRRGLRARRPAAAGAVARGDAGRPRSGPRRDEAARGAASGCSRRSAEFELPELVRGQRRVPRARRGTARRRTSAASAATHLRPGWRRGLRPRATCGSSRARRGMPEPARRRGARGRRGAGRLRRGAGRGVRQAAAASRRTRIGRRSRRRIAPASPSATDEPEAQRVFRLMRSGDARRSSATAPVPVAAAVRRSLAGRTAGDGRSRGGRASWRLALLPQADRRAAQDDPGGPGRSRPAITATIGSAAWARPPTRPTVPVRAGRAARRARRGGRRSRRRRWSGARLGGGAAGQHRLAEGVAVAELAREQQRAAVAERGEHLLEAAEPRRHAVQQDADRALELPRGLEHAGERPDVHHRRLAGGEHQVALAHRVLEQARGGAGAVDEHDVVGSCARP